MFAFMHFLSAGFFVLCASFTGEKKRFSLFSMGVEQTPGGKEKLCAQMANPPEANRVRTKAMSQFVLRILSPIKTSYQKVVAHSRIGSTLSHWFIWRAKKNLFKAR